MEESIFALALCNGAALGIQQLHRHGAAAFHQRFYLNVGAALFQGGVIFTPVSPKCPSAMWFLFTTSRLTSR